MFFSFLLLLFLSVDSQTHIGSIKRTQTHKNTHTLTRTHTHTHIYKTPKQGEDLERNDGSSERPYYMSPELHEILSKAMRSEETPAESQGDGGSPGEEETPLSQEDSEVQLKHQALLTQDNEQETLLKTDAEAPHAAAEEEEEEGEEEKEEKKEKCEEEADPKQETEKKEAKAEEAEEEIESQEEVTAKGEEVPAATEKETSEEKKDETGEVEPVASTKP